MYFQLNLLTGDGNRKLLTNITKDLIKLLLKTPVLKMNTTA